MHLAPPPIFRENSVMYTITRNVQCFSLKNQWNACIVMYILLKFSKTSKFFLKTIKIVNKIFEISSIFFQFFFQNTVAFLIYSKCLTFSQKNLKINKICQFFSKFSYILLKFFSKFLIIFSNLFNNIFKISKTFLNFIKN